MKKLLSTALAVVLTASSLSMAASAHKDFKKWGDVPCTDTKITVDGKMDDIYKKGFVVNIATRTDGKTGGATAKAYLVYSGTKMYCFVDVTDPEIIAIKENLKTGNFWENEGIEFTLDYKNDGSVRYKYTGYWDGFIAGSGNAKKEEAVVAGVKGDKGWTVEFEVSMPSDVKAGSDLGINLVLDDITSAGRGIIRSVQSGNATENEVKKYDYITLSATKVAPDAAKTTTTTKAAATADASVIAMLSAAVASGAALVFKKRK